MKITCPHCKYEFDQAEAIIKPAKEKYKWYEFSGNVSLCPNCKNRYVVDISIKGLVIILPIFIILFYCVNSNYYLAAMAITIITAITIKVFKHNLVVVKSVSS